MPRPTDHYTHDQFEVIDSDFKGETVRCVHCKHWSGSIKTLNRKKEHLLKCHAYRAWRAAGNGQDLPPPNRYTKRDSSAFEEADPWASMHAHEPNYAGPSIANDNTPVRNKVADLGEFFDEFWDDDATQKVRILVNYHISYFIYPELVNMRAYIAVLHGECKRTSVALVEKLLYHRIFLMFWPCNDRALEKYTRLYHEQCMRARCKFCGFVRAKNSTRQAEHLHTCQPFLNTSEGQQAIADGSLQQPPEIVGPRPDVYKGAAPNPTLTLNKNLSRFSNPNKANPTVKPNPQTPSLVNFLLSKSADELSDATQQLFLSHAGCGTLSAVAVQQFMSQQGHISRKMPTFIGKMIGKIRLNATPNPQDDTGWRTFDLLASTLNNTKRELEFLKTTTEKYGLQTNDETARHGTKGLVDLMEGASAPSASLLEGMVVLWVIEYLHCVSWQYADNFHQPSTGPTAASYSVPSYYQPNAYEIPSNLNEAQSSHNSHTAAIYESLIPNWTSPGFSQFVNACKAITDEIANAQTSGSGARELSNAVAMTKHIMWLWKHMWPEVTGMGEQEDVEEDGQNGGVIDDPIHIPDEDAPAAEFSA